MDGLEKLSPAQRRVLSDYERRIREAQQVLEATAPIHIKRLGKIIRRSLAKNTLVKFKRFLKEHRAGISKQDLPAFMDYLIINRIDLKDLEPAARERLRARNLTNDDTRQMTKDYREATADGGIPHCRDCRWFVTAPMDGEDNSEKSCVEMGTKGVDTACFGFIEKQ